MTAANDNDTRLAQEAAERDEARNAAIVAARRADIEEHGATVAPVEEQPAAPVADASEPAS